MKDLNHDAHGISHQTAWRALKHLRDFGVVEKDRFHNWSITEKGKELFCGDCKYKRKYIELTQKRHREISELLTYRAMHPEPLPRRPKRRTRNSK